MAKLREATITDVTGINFRRAKEIDIIEVSLVDADGEEYRHSLWLDGKMGPDKSIENARASLDAYGWDGVDLPGLVEPKGLEQHMHTPVGGVPVAYRVNEYTDNKGKLHVINQVSYVLGIGSSSLSKDDISAIASKLEKHKKVHETFDKDEELI